MRALVLNKKVIFIFYIFTFGVIFRTTLFAAEIFIQNPKEDSYSIRNTPKYSDVVMRTLRYHPANKKDPYSTINALRVFHVTRLEWAYISDKELIERFKNIGILFGGAVGSTSFAQEKEDNSIFDKVGILDRNGNLIIPPWKRTWKKTLWGCVNNPDFENGYITVLKKYVDAGIQSMHRDEPGANYLATNWGGCFCSYCINNFREYLKNKFTQSELNGLGIKNIDKFNYSSYLNSINSPVGDKFGKWKGGRLKKHFIDFQIQSSVDFHSRTRKVINDYAGYNIPFSCNNGSRRWTPIELQFDWFMGELSFRHARYNYLYDIIHKASSLGKLQVVTMPKASIAIDPKEWEALTRKTIATAYSLGGLCMVPWDIYMPGGSPRYFGEPEQYADLYAFVRVNAEYLDKYEEVFVYGKEIKSYSKRDSVPVLIEGEKNDVLASVRAVPNKTGLKPVVIHLVEWSDKAEPFKIKINNKMFFNEKSSGCDLLIPVPYNKRLHSKAEESGDYSRLYRRIRLKTSIENDWLIAEIPPLKPWGMIVISPI